MVNHLYSNFLHNADEYALSEKYWIDLWQQVEPESQERFQWQQPWFPPLPPSLGEGNPIFSAVSPILRRGIRVIQYEPTELGLEIQAWPDFFGGSFNEPESIEELVISCALSDLASRVAQSLLKPWVKGEAISFDLSEGDCLLTLGTKDHSNVRREGLLGG